MSEESKPPAGEFTGWFEAQGYPLGTDRDGMAEAFNAGWEYAGFARAAEPKDAPAKVIVVVEAPVGDRAPVERRYDANQADASEYGHLRLLRKGSEVATYQGSAWMSVRNDGATVPDPTQRKLGIALAALRDISERNAPGGMDAKDAVVRADRALYDIAELDL